MMINLLFYRLHVTRVVACYEILSIFLTVNHIWAIFNPFVVIAMVDRTPYKDWIVGNKSHVIRYSNIEAEAIRRCKEKVKAGFHMIADDRESQIVDRRKFCDRLRSYGNPLLRSFAIVCDPAIVIAEDRTMFYLLRSFAILRSYGNQSSAICDRNVSHNNFNSDSNDSTRLSNKAWMFVYVRYCSVRNTKFSQQCVEE